MMIDEWAPPPQSDTEVEEAAATESPTKNANASAACPRTTLGASGGVPRQRKRQGGGLRPQPKRRPPRTLKRRASENKPQSADVLKLMCVWGGAVKHPVPVWPLYRENGVDYFQVHEHCHWLRRACDNKGSTHYKDSRLAPHAACPAAQGVFG